MFNTFIMLCEQLKIQKKCVLNDLHFNKSLNNLMHKIKD